MTTQITEYDPIANGLNELKGKFKDVPDVSTKEGYQLVKDNIKEYKSLKKQTEEIRNNLLDESRKYTKNVNGQAKDIQGKLLHVFNPHIKAKEVEDERLKKIEEDKAEAEKIRVKTITDAIERIIEMPGASRFDNSEQLSKNIKGLEATEIRPEEFEEYSEEALEAKEDTLEELKELYEKTKTQEDEQERFDKQKREQDEKQLEIDADNKRIKEEQDEAQRKIDEDKRKLKEDQEEIQRQKDKAEEKRIELDRKEKEAEEKADADARAEKAEAEKKVAIEKEKKRLIKEKDKSRNKAVYAISEGLASAFPNERIELSTEIATSIVEAVEENKVPGIYAGWMGENNET